MRYIALLLLLPLLIACQTQSVTSETSETKRAAKSCAECTATDFPGGPNSFTETFCAHRNNCVNGNEQILNHAAQEKCSSLNTGNCTGDCPDGYECEGILDPDSDWKTALTVTAAIGAACPGVNQVRCTATVTIPAGEKLDCKCSCNP